MFFVLQTIKTTAVRTLSDLDPEILKQTSRPEWPVLLHNLCYLHGAIQLRARFGRAGWNNHASFSNIGNDELQVYTASSIITSPTSMIILASTLV